MLTICAYCGLKHTKKLPSTILEYELGHLPMLDKIKIRGVDGTFIKQAHNRQESFNLSPGNYHIEVGYSDTFPMTFQKYVRLGETTNISAKLSELYYYTRDTQLEVEHLYKRPYSRCQKSQREISNSNQITENF